MPTKGGQDGEEGEVILVPGDVDSVVKDELYNTSVSLLVLNFYRIVLII